jgi:hypothetical protein
MQICEGSSLGLPDSNSWTCYVLEMQDSQLVALQQLLLAGSVEHVLNASMFYDSPGAFGAAPAAAHSIMPVLLLSSLLCAEF